MRPRHMLIAAFSLAMIYSNVATILRAPSITAAGLSLPLPEPVYRVFVMHGVFSTFATNNTEVSVWGLTARQGTVEGFWKQLPTDEYFPFKRAEQRKRLWTSRQKREMSADAHHDIWDQLGRKIMTRYNRERPATPITAVALQSISWPSSSKGFYENQAEAIGKRQFWIIAEASNEKPTLRE